MSVSSLPLAALPAESSMACAITFARVPNPHQCPLSTRFRPCSGAPFVQCAHFAGVRSTMGEMTGRQESAFLERLGVDGRRHEVVVRAMTDVATAPWYVYILPRIAHMSYAKKQAQRAPGASSAPTPSLVAHPVHPPKEAPSWP